MKTRIQLFIWLSLLGLLASCYPNEITTTDELDVVATFYDTESLDSHQYKTYIMPDSVLHNDPDDESDHQFDQLILNTIDDNMEALGFQKLSAGSVNVDLIILPEVAITNNQGIGGCWDCWWWWDPWYPGWGWGYYPPYPPSFVYSYQTGSVIISMVDQQSVLNQDENSKAVWTCIINGLLRSSITGAEIQNYINQGFDQSSYLSVQ
ncbi:DUF4136 domain-containing protein [Reichenbachiella ulvae]|uniref:DUF4136 domain-containing protein n=1 Tax=Reichenbachiella ulvae TaxID=2980104 RepID=A0ABT3CR56_9BACT|nr:DUF4136 domain-containing protein [Reichenbachiella ulvae]MCV9386163.1 DUF4136 domain-containing protein [Reichenbachiella ulvae]